MPDLVPLCLVPYPVMWHVHLLFMVLHFNMSHSDPATAVH